MWRNQLRQRHPLRRTRPKPEVRMLPGVERAMMEVPRVFRDLTTAIKDLTAIIQSQKPEGHAVALTEAEWVEVVSAIQSKRSSLERGDPVVDDDYKVEPMEWAKELATIGAKITKALDLQGINV